MDDGSSKNKQAKTGLISDFKSEWSFFWEIINKDMDENLIPHTDFQEMDLDKIKMMTKTLSESRKELNLKLESVHKEIELNSIKLESLKLVGGEEHETKGRISQLVDIGQDLSNKLDKIAKLSREFAMQENALSEG